MPLATSMGMRLVGLTPHFFNHLVAQKLTFLLDVGFNREVAEDAAIYWSKDEGSLANAIDKCDAMTVTQRDDMGKKLNRGLLMNTAGNIFVINIIK